MRTCTRMLPGALLLSWVAVGVAWAQEQGSADASSTVPRTPWGDPDLQGVWDYRSVTPLERPAAFGDREFLTEEEVAALEGRAADRLDEPPDEGEALNLVHPQYATDFGRRVDPSQRTSLIVDPPDGQMPELTAAARERQQMRREDDTSHPSRPWLDRSLLERCITRGMPQAILPSIYNNNIAIVQSPTHVAIVHEMVHETRLVPLDGSEYTGIPGYMGESRGYWDGDTLVVETRNFNDQVSYRGTTENLVLTERYTRVGPDRLDFRMTLEDDETWVEPWTVAYSMRPTEGELYEYACHEGNRGLRNILENLAAAGQ